MPVRRGRQSFPFRLIGGANASPPRFSSGGPLRPDLPYLIDETSIDNGGSLVCDGGHGVEGHNVEISSPMSHTRSLIPASIAGVTPVCHKHGRNCSRQNAGPAPLLGSPTKAPLPFDSIERSLARGWMMSG